MEFQEIQSAVILNARKYGKKYSIKIDEDFVLLKLVEEVGELAEAVLILEGKSRPEKLSTNSQAKEKLAQELADVLGMAMVCGDVYGVDLEKALDEKWITKKKS